MAAKRSKNQDSAFESWFRAQFDGKYPDPEYHRRAQEHVVAIQRHLAGARMVLDELDLLAAQHDAALKAWQAAKMPEAKLRLAIKGVKPRRRR